MSYLPAVKFFLFTGRIFWLVFRNSLFFQISDNYSFFTWSHCRALTGYPKLRQDALLWKTSEEFPYTCMELMNAVGFVMHQDAFTGYKVDIGTT